MLSVSTHIIDNFLNQILYLEPKKELAGGRLKLEHIDTACGTLAHMLEFNVLREDDQILKMFNDAD